MEEKRLFDQYTYGGHENKNVFHDLQRSMTKIINRKQEEERQIRQALNGSTQSGVYGNRLMGVLERQKIEIEQSVRKDIEEKEKEKKQKLKIKPSVLDYNFVFKPKKPE